MANMTTVGFRRDGGDDDGLNGYGGGHGEGRGRRADRRAGEEEEEAERQEAGRQSRGARTDQTRVQGGVALAVRLWV